MASASLEPEAEPDRRELTPTFALVGAGLASLADGGAEVLGAADQIVIEPAP
ncbi:hypothetical protein [Amycolatopsis sp. cmx-4-68]|uniref:hypothetical protein n=1 Tax=Amycolatopsis sp. cmx-4-68 TaxID=2790938 RepID=UPI00397E24A6